MARVEPYGINLILTGDIREIAPKMERGSVNCIVCSPPYFGLRDYGVEGQIGLEETPEAYVDTLVGIFRELRRVLRDDGTVWLNLGDSYFSTTKGDSRSAKELWAKSTLTTSQGKFPKKTNPASYNSDKLAKIRLNGDGLKPKDLIGIPWRVALALQADGWYLRSDIIWAKKNPMPESVRDRPTKAHEYIFLLSKKARYYYDQEAIREPNSQSGGAKRRERWRKRQRENGELRPDYDYPGQQQQRVAASNPAGRNRRTVWNLATSPFPGAHFAVFPPDLIRPCILAGCPAKACADCGAPWARVVEREATNHKSRLDRQIATGGAINGGVGKNFPDTKIATIGFKPTCTCNAPNVPGVVFDPFMGSGTVAQVAIEEGRNWLGVELNPDYVKLAVERILNAKPKPPYEQTEMAYG